MPRSRITFPPHRASGLSLTTLALAVLGWASLNCDLAHAQAKAPAQQQSAAGQPLVSPRPGSTVKAQFGDWKHECSKPPGARLELCAITQDVTDESNTEVGVSVHIQKLPSGESLLRVVAPLGVLLTHNLAVKVDGDYLGEAPFLRCYVLGCQAQIEIDDKFRAKLSSARCCFW